MAGSGAVAAVLALISSVMWGVADFVGGTASRRVAPLQLIVLSTPLGVLPLAVFVFVVPGSMSAGVWPAAIVAGIAGALGILTLYRVLSAGPMGVMSPVSAVVAAVVPVVVGLVIGERPSAVAYVGMALAFLAVVLVSVEPKEVHEATPPVRLPTLAAAVVAGLLIGTYLAAIGVAPGGSGLWSVLLSRIVSSVLLVVVALAVFKGGALNTSILGVALLTGCLDAAANAIYRLAAAEGMLAVVSVLGSLYPAATVILAALIHHERLRGVQRVGMIAALGGAALLALS